MKYHKITKSENISIEKKYNQHIENTIIRTMTTSDAQ